MKKPNVAPTHKKRDKQKLKNYHTRSLLPVTGKIFERILYNNLYELSTENNLIYPIQSGFKAGDSCINHLLLINQKIYKLFDNGLEVWDILLEISRAFDKVWHKGPLFKLKEKGISGKLFDIITDFLNFIKQRVVLNG